MVGVRSYFNWLVGVRGYIDWGYCCGLYWLIDYIKIEVYKILLFLFYSKFENGFRDGNGVNRKYIMLF